MRLANPDLQRLLAGRYVLGTMRGPARDRFEAYVRYQPALADAVAAWEQHLQPLADVLSPEVPDEHVWERLSGRLWPEAPEESRSPGHRWFGWVQGLTYAVVALVALGVGWQLNTPDIKPPPLHLAVLNSEQGTAAYMICTDPRTGRTAIEVIRAVSMASDKVDQLWLLPADGGPQSVGLMPATGRKVIDFPAELAPLLASAKGLAVSREPSGGSPEAGPTGPVLYTGPVRHMWFPKNQSSRTASNSTLPAYEGNQTPEQPVLANDYQRAQALALLLTN